MNEKLKTTGLTDEQHKARVGCAMASDISSYSGHNPWSSPFTAWAKNLGIEGIEDKGSYHSHMGLALEGALLEEAGRRLEKNCLPAPGTIFHPKSKWAGCTPDGIFEDKSGIQIKNHSFYMARLFDGKPDEEEPPHGHLIPEMHLIQCTWEMMVTGATRWYLGAYFGGNDYRIYHLHRDQELIDILVENMHEFWKEHLDPKGPQTPPDLDGSASVASYFQHKYPKNNGEILTEVPEDAPKWAERYHQAHNNIKEWESAKSEAKNNLVSLTGEYDGIEGICTNKAPAPKDKVDWEQTARQIHKDMEDAGESEGLAFGDDLEKYIENNTTTPEPSRRFNLKWGPSE